MQQGGFSSAFGSAQDVSTTHHYSTPASRRQPDESWDSCAALPHYFTFKEPLCSPGVGAGLRATAAAAHLSHCGALQESFSEELHCATVAP